MNNTAKIIVGILVVALIGFAVWFSTKESATAQVTGVASYSDQVDLPLGSTVEIVLIDVSEAGIDSDVIAQQLITTKGEGSPFAFTLNYDPMKISEAGEYSVGARVRVNGDVWWTSTSNTLVITKGNPSTDVAVKLVNVR